MNKYLSAENIVEKTGLSRATVYKLLNTPDCPVLRIGRSIRISEEDFDKWLLTRFGSDDLVV